MKPCEKPPPQDYLVHYGVKGMRWGARRYRNYDGSYTREGLERYRRAESDCERVKSKAAETKTTHRSGQTTRQRVEDANRVVKTEKHRTEGTYDKLKTDKLAGKGKKLYQRGEAITGNTRTAYLAEAAIVVSPHAVSSLLSKGTEDQRTAQLAGSAITVGGTIVNVLLAGRAISENRKLRVFYAR